ncbi:MAG: hypothetical protein OXG53_08225 [Chloroflexi bacterium]|nr:hypothetical protein [Chloroflexota bacterium]
MERLSKDGDFVVGYVMVDVAEQQWGSDSTEAYFQAVSRATEQRFYGKGLGTKTVPEPGAKIPRYIVDSINLAWRVKFNDYPDEDAIIRQYESDDALAKELVRKAAA